MASHSEKEIVVVQGLGFMGAVIALVVANAPFDEYAVVGRSSDGRRLPKGGGLNTAITLNTFDWLGESNVSRVLFASTSETYAGTAEEFGAEIPTPEDVPLFITDLTQPPN
ncbi:hypothetical protein [Salinibacter ruber]|uniref:hypothetical protein n=1 Tax=Salinibacter ruber TaxID=146919 RepID=UPI002168E869|nr:hypothetical protein [Salinibacter ruber]MCS4150714.1 nucleoside-diphosphate-sugar epimerase [Salinibacter ruber]